MSLCICGGSHCSELKAQPNTCLRGAAWEKLSYSGCVSSSHLWLGRTDTKLMNESRGGATFLWIAFLPWRSVAHIPLSTWSPDTCGQPNGGNGIFYAQSYRFLTLAKDVKTDSCWPFIDTVTYKQHRARCPNERMDRNDVLVGWNLWYVPTQQRSITTLSQQVKMKKKKN